MTSPAATAVLDLRRHPGGRGPVVVHGSSVPDAGHRRVRLVAVALLAVLNGLDVVTTRAFLAAGLPEGNPVADVLITRGWLGGVKAALLVALALRMLRSRPRLGTTCALWFANGVYAAVVAVNLMALSAM